MRAGLTIILSIITGVLIAIPGAFSFEPTIGVPFILLFAAMGGLVGYKRRNSDAFFYFTLICSVTLLTMISLASFKAQQALDIEKQSAQ